MNRIYHANLLQLSILLIAPVTLKNGRKAKKGTKLKVMAAVPYGPIASPEMQLENFVSETIGAPVDSFVIGKRVDLGMLNIQSLYLRQMTTNPPRPNWLTPKQESTISTLVHREHGQRQSTYKPRRRKAA